MKILFLTDNFPPEVNAPARRTFEHCREWVKKGHEVTVITCAPNFPNGVVFSGYSNKLYSKEAMDGIKVVRVWTYISANKGVVKRSLDYLSFGLMSSISSLFIKTDVIIATSPQFFSALGGYMSHFLKRKPWIFEVRDLWPESIAAVGAITNSKTIRFLERLELFLYKKAKHIVVVTDSFKKNISNRGIDPTKISVIKNGIIIDEFMSAPHSEKIEYEFENPDLPIVGYLGTHGLAHGLDFILKEAKELESVANFVLIGDGAEKSKLEEYAREHHLKNVILHKPIPKQKIKDYICSFDFALVNLKKSDTFKKVIPSKIFENAALQKPILLGVEGEAKDLVESYNCGLAYEPENSASFRQVLMKIINDKNLQIELRAGCLELTKDFDRKELANKMIQLIENYEGE